MFRTILIGIVNDLHDPRDFHRRCPEIVTSLLILLSACLRTRQPQTYALRRDREEFFSMTRHMITPDRSSHVRSILLVRAWANGPIISKIDAHPSLLHIDLALVLVQLQ